MAAASSAPTAPTVNMTPAEALDFYALAMANAGKRLLARVDFLERENLKVSMQLRDALDAVEEMRGQLRTKDEIIGELQQLTGRRA